jgi:hypothetical protein
LNPDETDSALTRAAYDEESPFRAARDEPLLTRAIPVSRPRRSTVIGQNG